MLRTPTIKHLGLVPYLPTWQAMQDFTAARTLNTADEIWVLEHPPVYTLGRNADPQHVLNSGDIPLIPIDRGGQVTYHGPGQLVVYPLINIDRYNLNVRQLVSWLENAVIRLLTRYSINAVADPKAPGVYIDSAKVASIGLRVSKGNSYHGLSLNIDMDLHPFSGINPCGFENLRVTQLAEQLPAASREKLTLKPVANELVNELFTTLDKMAK